MLLQELKIENHNKNKESNLSKKTECKIDTDLELNYSIKLY